MNGNILVKGNETVYPYGIAELKRDNPQTSFPREMTPEILQEFDVFPVSFAEKPNYDPTTEKLLQSPSPELIDGQWQFTYTVTALDAEELNAVLLQKSQEVRRQRDRRLQESDWVVIRSYEQAENVPLEWTEYRQALRDIPQQTGFPSEVSWPTVPE